MKEALLNTAMLLYAAYGTVTLYDIVRGAAFAADEPGRIEARKLDRQASFMSLTLNRAKHAPAQPDAGHGLQGGQ